MTDTCKSADKYRNILLVAGASKGNILPSTKVTNSTSFKIATPEKKPLSTAATYSFQDGKRKPQVKPKGFQVWRQNKTEKGDASNDNLEDKNAEVNILHVVHPEDESQERRIRSPTASICTSVSQQTLSPDMFDSLADQIVTRVKKELNLNMSQLPREREMERKVYSPNSHTTKKRDSKVSASKIDSHHCPGCGLLMVKDFLYNKSLKIIAN